MTRTLRAAALSATIAAGGVAAVHAEGLEANMSRQAVAKEMFVSTQSSYYPGSSPASSAVPASAANVGVVMVLGILTLALVIGATASRDMYYIMPN